MSPSKSELTPSQNELKKMRENTEVLDALFLVDKELEGVDDWIGEQLDRLVGIQTKLAVIETESGMFIYIILFLYFQFYIFILYY